MLKKRMDVVKTNTKSVSKQADIIDLENIVKSTPCVATSSELLENLNTALENNNDSNKRSEETQAVLRKVYNNVAYAFSLDNHVAICNTVSEPYQALLVNMTKDLIAEFDCRNSHEKALAEMVASSYVHYIQYSSKFNNAQNAESLSFEKIGFYKMFGKEADRAHRQFTAAITILKQIRTPFPTINIKTNSAFIAENQQLNTVNETKEQIP